MRGEDLSTCDSDPEPTAKSTPAKPTLRDSELLRVAERAVSRPALAMALVAILMILFSVIGFLSGAHRPMVTDIKAHPTREPYSSGWLESVLDEQLVFFFGATLLIGAAGLIASILLARLERKHFVQVSAVALALPSSYLFPFGVLAGAWVLLSLRRASVSRGFAITEMRSK